LVAAGSETELRSKGKIRMEGRDYVTQDGDVLHIHFKV
jgi:ribosome-binding ATPase YchF (GTP1/OBG family)